MFLMIIDVYWSSNILTRSPNLFELILTYIYRQQLCKWKFIFYSPFLAHLDWTQWDNVEPQPFITPKEFNNDGAMMGQGQKQTHSLHWGINPSKNTTPPPLSCQVCPPLNFQTVKAPLFRQSPLWIGFSWPPPIKVEFFSDWQKYESVSSITSSYLLKATKFLVKSCQFEFLVMTEKNFYF